MALNGCRFQDFKYILDKTKKSPVCFGSGVPRRTTLKINDCFVVKKTELTFDANVDQMKHNGPVHGERSIMWSFTKSARWPRDKNYDSAVRVSTNLKKTKNVAVPFNQSSPARPTIIFNSYPGPGTYNPNDEKKQIKFHHSFGGKKTIVRAITIKCVPFNDDACLICDIKCSQQGDYWHKENKYFICRACLKKIYHNPTRYKNIKLNEYRPIRDCFFAHHHEGYKNSIQLVGFQEMKRKIYKEAYFDLYFSNIDKQ